MSALVTIDGDEPPTTTGADLPAHGPMSPPIRSSSDAALLRHLLPWFVLVVLLGPAVVLTARWFGVPDTIGLGLGLVTTLAVLGRLLITALREHRRLIGAIEARDAQLLSVLDRLPIGVMVRAADGTSCT